MLFSSYAAFVDRTLTRHDDIFERMGLDRDDIKDLKNDLHMLEDAYKEGREDETKGSSLSEDEEF